MILKTKKCKGEEKKMKGVIFDLDGVLVSTDELHYQAWKKLADELGITEFNREDNMRQRGVSRMASLEIVLEKGDKTYTQKKRWSLQTEKTDTMLKCSKNWIQMLYFREQ